MKCTVPYITKSIVSVSVIKDKDSGNCKYTCTCKAVLVLNSASKLL